MKIEISDLSKFLVEKDVVVNVNDPNILGDILKAGIVFECPDFYSVLGDTVYLIEHFEFDSTKHTKKGSSNRIEINKDEARMNEFFKKNPNKSIYNGCINTQVSSEDYLANLEKVFLKHYNKIPQYKENVAKCLNKKAEEINFKTIFYIVDRSIFGTMYFDEKGHHNVLPVMCKEFQDLLVTHKDVDYVLCSSDTKDNSTISIFGSRRTIIDGKFNSIELSKITLAQITPMTLSTQIVIPIKH